MINIDAIGAIGSVPLGSVAPTTATTPAGGSDAAVRGAGFASILQAVDGLQGMQATADTLAVAAATGDLTDVHDWSIAAAQARTAVELATAVRNRGLEAFSEIMRMQV